MQWLAQGSSLLNRLWGSDKDAIRQHTATETLRLRPFLGKDAYKRYKREIRLGDELRAIFNKAMELDNMFMSSKAYFSVNWTDSCLNTGRKHYYDEQFMEVEGNLRPLTPRSGVDFFISPILVKIGNADGENFDSKMLLAKAQVMCD